MGSGMNDRAHRKAETQWMRFTLAPDRDRARTRVETRETMSTRKIAPWTTLPIVRINGLPNAMS